MSQVFQRRKRKQIPRWRKKRRNDQKGNSFFLVRKRLSCQSRSGWHWMLSYFLHNKNIPRRGNAFTFNNYTWISIARQICSRKGTVRDFAVRPENIENLQPRNEKTILMLLSNSINSWTKYIVSSWCEEKTSIFRRQHLKNIKEYLAHIIYTRGGGVNWAMCSKDAPS